MKFEGWQCQSCGAPIGYLGRFFMWAFGPFAPHYHKR